MTSRDPAFLWETEALRGSPQRVAENEPNTEDLTHPAGNWLTLRAASAATAIPVETLRKWARRATVPTFLTPAAGGTNIRMVDLNGVLRRAAELGREVHRTETRPPTTAVRNSQPGDSVSPVTAAAPVAQEANLSVPTDVPANLPGTMIVPVDAWNKMLNQLGNLHEAGQQLAVARERAAKAETEARFLRERLAEIRNTSTTPPGTDPGTPPGTDPGPTATTRPTPQPRQPPEKVWHYLLRRARNRS